jgi:protein tyrosine phosphatase (PTP) superfamily phosphohydrolase (DUF442 family)
MYFDYFEPYIYPLRFLQGEVEVISENILVGPYPHYDEIKRLKEKFGVSAIVSLLDPRLPQERALQEREDKMAERIGLPVYNFPIRWINMDSRENQESIQKMIALIKSLNNKKVYIHCYLGRHRIKIVKEGLKEEGLIYEVSSSEE